MFKKHFSSNCGLRTFFKVVRKNKNKQYSYSFLFILTLKVGALRIDEPVVTCSYIYSVLIFKIMNADTSNCFNPR